MNNETKKEKYNWSGVYVKIGNRGPELTKQPHVHTPLKYEPQEDSAADNQPPPPLKDTDSSV